MAAQTQTARVRVEVRAESGAAVAGADVRVQHSRATDGVRGLTDADGIVVFPTLAPATYVVEISAAGFRPVIVRELVVSGGLQATLPVHLTPGGGAYADSVVVTASAGTLRMGAGENGHTFDGDRLRDQPSAERDILTFTQQAAGMAPPAPGSRLSTQGNTSVNSSGAREASNNFLIDGLDNNDWFLDRLIVNPSLDAVASVTLRQNTYDAEFGRSAGARVDVLLKSGTTRLSGSAYEFYRPSPRHLFGGTAGGPIGGASASSFFFISAEGITAREADPRSAHVPTLGERSGDFSASGAAIVDPFTGKAFAGNVIPAARISAASRAVAALYPLPTGVGAAINFSATPDATRGASSATIKTDHRLGNDDRLSLRYSFSRDRREFPFVARNRNLPGFGLADFDRGQSVGGSFDKVLQPSVLNVLRAGLTWSRRENLPGQHGIDGFAALGVTGPALTGIDLGFPNIAVSGFETLGDDPNLPVVRDTRTVHVSDVLTIERGPHQLRLGAEWRTFASDGDNHLFARGKVSFSGAFTGNAFADLLLGYPSFALIGRNDNRQALRTWALDGFVQDEWRVSARLTVATGLRYEFNAPPTDADNRMRIFDQTRLTLVDVGVNGVSSSGLDRDLNNFAPRLGVSWDVTGQGRTILRGGYGIFYDAGTLIENSALYFNPPYYTLQVFVPSAAALLRIENPFPTARGITPLTSVNTVDPHFRTAYAHQTSASVEHAIGATVLTARYVAAFGRNLVRKRNLNQPPPGPGAIDARRPLQGFGDILFVESQAHSTYHGLQLSLDRRLTDGLEAHAAYTFSSSMDDASAFLGSDGNDNTPQDSRNLGAEWAPSDFDVRHRFVGSVTWTAAGESLPWLLRGWRVGALLTAQSGRPFTPRLSIDNSNTGNAAGTTFAADRPDVLTGAAAPGQPTSQYGGHTFVVPARYTFGNAGRNMLRGPGYVSVDALVARTFHRNAERSVEFRLEVFNLLNRVNGQLPDSFVDRATFGQVLATYPARQWQLAVKFAF